MSGTRITCPGCDRTLKLKPGKQLTSKSCCPTCGESLLPPPPAPVRVSRSAHSRQFTAGPAPVSGVPNVVTHLVKGFVTVLVLVALFALKVSSRLERRGYFDSADNSQPAAMVQPVAIPYSTPAASPLAGAAHHESYSSGTNTRPTYQSNTTFSGLNVSYTVRGNSSPQLTVRRDGVEVDPEVILSEITTDLVQGDGFQTRLLQTKLFGISAIKVHPSRPIVFASALEPPTVQSWSLETGQVIDTENLRQVIGDNIKFGERITCFGMTSEGSRMLVGSNKGTIWVFKVSQTGAMKYERAYFGHGEEILSITSAPTGDLVASASKTQKARCWNAATGREIFATPPLSDNINAMRFVGRTQLWLTDGQQITCWNPDSGTQLLTEETNRNYRSGPAAFSTNGSEVVFTHFGDLKRYSTSDASFQSLFDDGPRVEYVRFMPGDTQLVAGSREQVTVWNLNGEIESRIAIQLLNSRLKGLDARPDGSLVLATDLVYGQIWHLQRD